MSQADPAIRPLRADDEEDIYRICLLTGADGGDASGLYADPRLLGHIYAGPYVRLAANCGFVIEDGGRVSGYILGAADTTAFEARLEDEWWPALRASYSPPDRARKQSWTADEHRIWQIHHPWRTPAAIAGPYPAHLHIDLLPRLQGRGLGRKLIDRWRMHMHEQGAAAAHLGVSLANVRALAFYEAVGWRRLRPSHTGEATTAWFVTDL